MAENALPDILELSDATVLHDLLHCALQDSPSYTLDLSHVQRASLACLQVVISALRLHGNAEKGLQVVWSAPLQEALADFGLDQFSE